MINRRFTLAVLLIGTIFGSAVVRADKKEPIHTPPIAPQEDSKPERTKPERVKPERDKPEPDKPKPSK